MRNNLLATLVPLTALFALPSLAAANCYSVYDPQNRLAFQSTVAPVDLSGRISEAMRARFPGGYLVMIPDDSDCLEFRSGPTVSPRFDGGNAAAATSSDQLLQASPLMRGSRSAATGGDGAVTGNAIATREAARSGNALDIKRGARP